MRKLFSLTFFFFSLYFPEPKIALLFSVNQFCKPLETIFVDCQKPPIWKILFVLFKRVQLRFDNMQQNHYLHSKIIDFNRIAARTGQVFNLKNSDKNSALDRSIDPKTRICSLIYLVFFIRLSNI